MSTAADVVRRALKLLGVLAAGESLGAADLSDGIDNLNLLLGTWANQRLLVHGTRRAEYSLTPGSSPHTIGVGADLDAARPLRITGAGIIGVGQVQETSLTILDDAAYQAISDKTLTAELPERLWVEWSYPNASLWLWPVPTTAATIVLYTWSRLTELTQGDTVSWPDGYENALSHALAIQIAPMYGVEPSGVLQFNAAEALAAIKRINNQSLVTRCDPAVLGRRGPGSLQGGGGTDSGGLY